MKSNEFFGITEEAAKLIIGLRELQSVDFEASQSLLAFANQHGQDSDAATIGLRLHTFKNGKILTHPNEQYPPRQDSCRVS
jgi:hypothetical protein